MTSARDQDGQDNQETLTIYSVGHSNHPIETFVTLLKDHTIQCLVDVRSSPYSRYVTHFNRADLKDTVERQGIRYVYLGDELGGRPPGDEFYDAEGYVLYYRAARAPFFLRGLERLKDEAAQHRTAIMCSEEDPTNCHRRLLIARVIERQGARVIHIRADGREQVEDDLVVHHVQPTIWDAASGDESDEQNWKSIRPVLQRRPQSSSSNRSDEWESDDSSM